MSSSLRDVLSNFDLYNLCNFNESRSDYIISNCKHTGEFPPNYIISVSLIIYSDNRGTIPFVGDGDFYHTQIDSSGNVTGSISLC
jgi:hypothetical protein